MMFLKTVAQYLIVGTTFGLVGLTYSLLELSGAPSIPKNIATIVSIVVAFLLARKVFSWLEPIPNNMMIDEITNIVGSANSSIVVAESQKNSPVTSPASIIVINTSGRPDSPVNSVEAIAA